jgi:hypothetical protein
VLPKNGASNQQSNPLEDERIAAFIKVAFSFYRHHKIPLQIASKFTLCRRNFITPIYAKSSIAMTNKQRTKKLTRKVINCTQFREG